MSQRPGPGRGSVAVKKRLGELLVEAGVIDAMQLQAALAHQRKWGGRLGACLVSLQFASEAQVVSGLASRLGFPVADLSALEPSPELEAALRLVPEELALRHHLLPLGVDRSCLTLAMADPTNVVAADEVSFRVGRRVRIVIAGDGEIVRVARRLYRGEAEEPRDPPTPPAPPAGPEARATPPPLPSPRQAALLEALERVARGEESSLIDPNRLTVALARLVVRKGLVADAELLAELAGE